MSADHTKKSASIQAADYPALRNFLRGYFHQDMKDEYGSAGAAARQFCEDASSQERAAAAEEWSRLMEKTKGQPMEEINRILTGLGSAYRLTSGDMQKISAVLGQPRPH